MSTPFTVTGPAAGSALLRTAADPTGRTVLGTLNNCAGGTTPWGTVLSGEENINGYFRTRGTDPADARYGFRDAETARGWEHEDPRFDARTPGYENEPNRFGWIVELDPFAPDEPPVKHTALGRFKHEGANVIVAPSGRVTAYMGDDERFDYLYKFVSTDTMRTGTRPADRAHNKTLLSRGSLYVARFRGDSPAAEIDGSGTLPADGAFDGTGEWLPLLLDGVSQVPGFSADEVAVFTRLAADAVGATKMDRCEDVEPSPTTGRVYVACTNNTDRGKADREGATEPNPRVANRDGHVVELRESGDDPTATTFTWSLLLVCGDPAQTGSTYFAGFPADRVSPISCPDNLAFDASGNLWISTDGQPGTIGYCDGLFKVPLEGAERGRVQQLLAVPTEAETCGPVIDEAESMVYVAVQHPGEDGAWDAQHSGFPDYVPAGRRPHRGDFAGPRPAVVQVWRD
jgi:secreted PhoX family phosphatase